MTVWVVLVSMMLGVATSMAAPPFDPAARPEVALETLLARSRGSEDCAATTDRLRHILCSGVLKVGVRGDYPLFGMAAGTIRSGYEVDIAERIARQLGVTLSLVTVSPANRIALLAEDRIDLVMATMGHTTLRDAHARFIRPHYYASSTELVGPRAVQAADLSALAGRTVCVTVGNASNAELSRHGARLLLFDNPEQLIDRLNAGVCMLAAQDDSFFAKSFTDPRFSALYDRKFHFAPLPWGMAVANQGGEDLATALSLISQMMHRDGVFVDLARDHHIDAGFLMEQRAVWNRPTCDRADGFSNPDCVLRPHATDLAPTLFASRVSDFEHWLGTQAGIHPVLTMFKIAPAWDLIRWGLFNSIILIAATLASTLLFAVVFGLGLSTPFKPLLWSARAIMVLVQSTPIVLSLVIAATIANTVFSFSSTVALAAAAITLGLTNGSYAGQAISEAIVTLRSDYERLHSTVTAPKMFMEAMRRSLVQIVSFLINATKGTPAASFIGAPELLNALTDTTSFSSDRTTTYWLLLIFYTLAVLLVIQLCTILRRTLEREIARPGGDSP